MTETTNIWAPGLLGLFSDEEVLWALGDGLGSDSLPTLAGADEAELARAAQSGARSLVVREVLTFTEVLDDETLDDGDDGDSALVLSGPLAVVANMRRTADRITVVETSSAVGVSTVVLYRDPTVPLLLCERILPGGYHLFELLESEAARGLILERIGEPDTPGAGDAVSVPRTVTREQGGQIAAEDLEWTEAAGGVGAAVHVTHGALEDPDTVVVATVLVMTSGQSYLVAGAAGAGPATVTPYDPSSFAKTLQDLFDDVAGTLS